MNSRKLNKNLFLENNLKMTCHKPRYSFTGAKEFFIKLGFTPKSLEKLSQEEADNTIDDFFSMPILNQKEISVLISRYGLANGNRLTLEKIGEIFNFSRERIRQIENEAIKKINYPRRFNEKGRIVSISKRNSQINKMKNFISSLEYDVLYSHSFFLEKIGNNVKNIWDNLRLRLTELDMSLIRCEYESRIMRIGEQEEDLPIISTPICTPEYNKEHYVQCWENLAKSVKTKGYATYRDSAKFTPLHDECDKTFYHYLIKDFIAENELPVALPQEYRQGIRKPLVVYHPKILRQIQHKK